MSSYQTVFRLALAAALVGAAAAPAAAVGQSSSQGRGQGGGIVSVEQVAQLTPEEVAGQLRGQIDAAQVRFGVTAYRVEYRTTDSAGAPTTASQLVVLPKNDAHRLPTVSWLHGTTVYRKDVASQNPKATDRLVALLFASTGRAVSAPDYVGLGSGPGFHPYGDPSATVSASVDALRATRALAHLKGRELERKVQVSGFSQGGPATMMVGRALDQEKADRYFRLGALAPVSGPFDLSAFEAAAANDEIDHAGLYLAYFATAWNKMYGLYDSPGEAFKDPYDKKVEGLFDGNSTQKQIAEALPSTSEQLFTEDFLNKVRQPSGVLKERLRPLDHTCDWKPDVPVSIYYARGDQDVANSNSSYCAAQLAAHGVGATLTDVGDVDHNGSVRLAVPGIIRFFDAARKTG
ncbi:lipase family protein [Streptomyces sp. Edi4]|uniref:alpha/beta hydrolase family protein n=1 Tax=Streptomyces sp. Edi4 TaxID=3162527 RepID=UPI0033059FA7